MTTKTYRICTLPGDGIGPEIMSEAKKVLAAIGERHDVEFVCEDGLIGGAAIDATEAQGRKPTALPDETLAAAKKADAATLLTAAQDFARQTAGADPKFVAYASTWLNGERWLDQPDRLAPTSTGDIFTDADDLDD